MTTTIQALTYTDFNTLLITKCLWEHHRPGRESGTRSYFLAERHIFMDWVCEAFDIEEVRSSKLAEQILHHFTLCIAKELQAHNIWIKPRPAHTLSQFARYHFQVCVQRATSNVDNSAWISEYHFPFAVLFWTMLVHTELDEEETKNDGGFHDTALQLWRDSGAETLLKFKDHRSLTKAFEQFALTVHTANSYAINSSILPKTPLMVNFDSFINHAESPPNRPSAKHTLIKLGFIQTEEAHEQEDTEGVLDDLEVQTTQTIQWKKVRLPHYTKIGRLPPKTGPYTKIGFCKLMGFPSASDTRLIAKMLVNILQPNGTTERSLSQLGTQNKVLLQMKRIQFGRYSAGPITQLLFSQTMRLRDATDWWTTISMVDEYYTWLGQGKQIQTPTRIHLAFDKEANDRTYPALIINKKIPLTFLRDGQPVTLPVPTQRFSGDKQWWKLSLRGANVGLIDDIINGNFKNYGAEMQKQIQRGQIWMERTGEGFRSFKATDYPLKYRFICLAKDGCHPTENHWIKKVKLVRTDSNGDEWYLYQSGSPTESIECARAHLDISSVKESEVGASIDIQGLTHISQILGYKWLRPSFQRTPEEDTEKNWIAQHNGNFVSIPLQRDNNDCFLLPKENLVGSYEDIQTQTVYNFTCTPIYLGFPAAPPHFQPAEFEVCEEGSHLDQIYSDELHTITVSKQAETSQCWIGNRDSTAIHIGDVIIDEIRKCDFWDASGSIKAAQTFNQHINEPELQNIFDQIKTYVDVTHITNVALNTADFCEPSGTLERTSVEKMNEFEQCLMSLLQGSLGHKSVSGLATFGLGNSGKIRSVLDLLQRQLLSLTINDQHLQVRTDNWLYSAHKALYSMGLVNSYYNGNRFLPPTIETVPPWPYTSFGVQPHVALYHLQEVNGHQKFEATLCGLASIEMKELFISLTKKIGGTPYHQKELSPLVPTLQKARFASRVEFNRFKETLNQYPDLPTKYLCMPSQWNLKEQLESLAADSQQTFGQLEETHFPKLRIWNWEIGGWRKISNSNNHFDKFGVLILNIEFKQHPPQFQMIFKSDHPYLKAYDHQDLQLTAVFKQQHLTVNKAVRFATRIQRDALFLGFMFAHAYQAHQNTTHFPVSRGVDFPLYIARFLTIVSDSNHGPLVTTTQTKHPIHAYESVYINSLLQQLITL